MESPLTCCACLIVSASVESTGTNLKESIKTSKNLNGSPDWLNAFSKWSGLAVKVKTEKAETIITSLKAIFRP